MSSSEENILLDAEDLARTFYAGKFRSGHGNREYIEHPLALVAILRRHGINDYVVLAGALLHDAIEECAYDPTVAVIIERVIGREVVKVVREMTDLNVVTRDERRNEQILRAADYSHKAALIRIADKLANLTEILENPPKWAAPHIIKYADFAMRVVNVCGHACPAMAAECAIAFKKIEARYANPGSQIPRS
jgi:guanosine-3',5'-bis(diphosphate) 3'-pyrophosphohydrolase